MDHYIAQIRISPAVEFKIRIKHHLTGEEVRFALIYRTDVIGKGNFHPIYGFRLKVRGKLENGQMLIAYLHPLNRELGIWFLGTAWKI